MAIFPGSAIPSAVSDYEIDNSVRFEGGDSAYLSRTAGTATSNDIGTFSFWYKKGEQADAQGIFSNHADSSNRTYINFDLDNLQMFGKISGSTNVELITTAKYRDPSAWYHFVIAVDVTQVTASDRVKVYVNNVRETSFSTETYPAQNTDLPLFSKTNMHIGARFATSLGDYCDGYLADFYYIDGTALTPSSFAELDSDTNQWKPIEYTGSYGTNGFYLKFQDSSSLGDDSSGNTNDFTATNLVATDQMVDSPTNSFCTLNPLDMTWSYPTGQPIGPPTLSEGNLKSTKTSGSSGYEQSRGTIAVDSGKWYFEMLLVNAGSSNHQAFGICTTSTDSLRWWGGAKDTQWTCQNDGTSMNGDGSDSGFLTYAAGDVMSCAFDVDAGKIWWAKNGTWGASGNPATGANARYTNVATSMAADGNPVAPFNVLYSSSASEFFNFGADSSFAGAKTAQGNQDGNDKGDFYYEPPSGFLALCTDNLPDPEIALPGEHLDTVLVYRYRIILMKYLHCRFSLTSHGSRQDSFHYNHNLFDVVRGVTKELYPNDTNAENDRCTVAKIF